MSAAAGTASDAARRRLVADLDAEETWRRRLRPDLPTGPLPRAVLDRISAYGTLMRVYALSDDDVLVLPRRIDAERLTDVLPRPRVTTLDDETVPGAAEAVRWAVTQGRGGRVAARANHRAFALALQRRLGVAFPGASWVTDHDNLPPAVDAASAQGSQGRWVAKAPLSTAGRDRVVGGGEPDAAASKRLQKLLRRSGGLVVEPWVERLDDLGVLLEIHGHGADLLGIHRQHVGDRGAFHGVNLDPPDVAAEHRERLAEMAHLVGDALHRVGYRGPAGVDAWTWRRADGGVALHPLGEINARRSFGRVARDLAARLGRPGLALRLGTVRDLPESGGADILLRPAEDGTDDAAAWVE